MRRAAMLCTLSLITVGLATPAAAIPAFARREHAPCQMCHFRMPELNEDGHAYVRRGLREEPPSQEEIAGVAADTPAEEATNLPAAATTRPLGQPLPLDWGNYLTVMGHHMLIARRGQRADFDAGVIDVWVAGPLDRHWSGLANPSFNIEEGGSEVEQAYGQYLSRWADRFGSARFGQVMPFAILFNQGGPSMPLTTPLVLGTPPDTGSTWTPTTLLRGVEVGAVDLPRWNVYLGAGQPHPEDSPDDRRHTDLYASGEYLLTPDGNSLTAYGYWGKAALGPVGPDRSFHRLGLFANAYPRGTKLTAAYLAGSDDAADGRSLDSAGYFLLAERLLTPQWAAYARYDHLRQDLAGGGSRTTQGPALGISWWAQTQARLTVEGQFLDTTNEPTDRVLATEFMWAF